MDILLEANEPSELSFADFLQECVDGNIFGQPMTFDQWKREKFRNSLSPEYHEYVSQDLIQAQGDFTKLHGGNFFDWMADVKGLKLTVEEEAMRSHKPSFDQVFK